MSRVQLSSYIPNKAVAPPMAGIIAERAVELDAKDATPSRANPPETTGKFTKISWI